MVLACAYSLNSRSVGSYPGPWRFTSAIAHLLDVLGVSLPLHIDVRSGAFNFLKFICREFNFGSSDVFFQTMQFGCAWNGNDPRLSCQQPCQSDLPRRRFLLCRKLVE